jgi:hypothetical protein
MKLFYLIGCLIAALPLFANKKALHPYRSSDHVAVPGTRIRMIPPQGFVVSPNFSGFQQESTGSSIMVVSMPASFDVISKEMLEGGLAKQGIKVESQEEVQISERPALLISGSQKAYGLYYTKYTLIFGTDSETIVINGATPIEKRSAANAIRKSLLTTLYDPAMEIDPLAHADFTIDCSEGPFVFAGGVANSLIFTVDGELPPRAADKSTLIVAKSFSELSADHRNQFALQRLHALPLDIEKVITTDTLVVDSLPGYRILAEGKEAETGNIQKILLTLLFGDSFYYLLVGTTPSSYEHNLGAIEKTILQFKRK